MPNLALNEADVAALIEYLAARDAGHAASRPRSADAAAPAQ
jgi:hypothetical protein